MMINNIEQRQQQQQREEEAKLVEGAAWQLERKYTLSEIQQHNSLDDCWMVIFDKVYNITEFVDEHPGGDYILLEYAGRDATHPFLSSRHGSSAYKLLDKYWIGILVDEELYYSNNSSYCSVYSNLSWRTQPTLDSQIKQSTTILSTTTNTSEEAAAAPETKLARPHVQPANISTSTTTTASTPIRIKKQKAQTRSQTQPDPLSLVDDHIDSDGGSEDEDDDEENSEDDECEEAAELEDSCWTTTTSSSLARLWSKATRAVLRRADKGGALSSSRSSRLQCVRHIALASGWHIL